MNKPFFMQMARAAVAVCFLALFVSPVAAQYSAMNLVSNTSGLRPMHLDSNLVNGWGLASSPTGPFWVSDQNSSDSTLYMANGTIIPLVVQIPCVVDGTVTTPCSYPAKGELFEPLAGKNNLFGPTGIVWNAFSSSGAFIIPGSSQPASFIFATLDGLIVAWSPQVNRTEGGVAANRSSGVVVANRSSNGASYNGLAITEPQQDKGLDQGAYLYATNSVPGGKIDVFDSRFNFVNSFVADPNTPTGFMPYGVQTIGDKLYVTYFNPTGLGGGVLDVCDLRTSLTAPACHRLYASLPVLPQTPSGTSGTTPIIQPTVLDGPWGIAMAPQDFGSLSNKLLVGNVIDGKIHAFEPDTGALVGTLMLSNDKAFAVPGLWAMKFGQGTPANGSRNQLFFTAGPAPLDNPALLFSEGMFGAVVPANARPGQ